MVIAIDFRFAEKKAPAADDNWALHYFRQMAHDYPQYRFIFIGSQPWPSQYFTEPNISTVKAGPPAHRYRLLQYWYNFRLPALLRKYKASVFVGLGNHVSQYTKVPQCVIVNHLPQHPHAQGMSKSQISFYKANQQQLFNKAVQILVTSQYGAEAIAHAFPNAATKVQAVHPQAAHVFCPASYEQQEATREQYSDGKAYFLVAGDLLPQNNIMNLLKAFSQFKKMQKSNMQLLLAGRNLWPKNELAQSLLSYKYRQDVVLTGYLPPAEMARVMAAAYALAQPAELPGFAMPPLEAMQCGVPVIVTVTGALPEICGPAALYAVDGSVKEIATQMMLVFKNETLRSEKIQAGVQQAATYQQAPQQLAQAIISVVKAHTLTTK